MAESPRIRRLRASDLERVAGLEQVTFSDPWSRKSLRDSLESPDVHALAAVDEGDEVIGYGMSLVAADEGEILNIAVSEDERGRGHGAALLEALLAHLRGAGVRQVYLEVRRSNHAAIALYRKSGFVPLGMRPRYYTRPREDALVMGLTLTADAALE